MVTTFVYLSSAVWPNACLCQLPLDSSMPGGWKWERKRKKECHVCQQLSIIIFFTQRQYLQLAYLPTILDFLPGLVSPCSSPLSQSKFIWVLCLRDCGEQLPNAQVGSCKIRVGRRFGTTSSKLLENCSHLRNSEESCKSPSVNQIQKVEVRRFSLSLSLVLAYIRCLS